MERDEKVEDCKTFDGFKLKDSNDDIIEKCRYEA
jgi:hypothetical protein